MTHTAMKTWVDTLTGVWDWLWLRCAHCSFTQSGLVKRGRPAGSGTSDIGACPCGSFEFVVLERRWNQNRTRDTRPVVALPVLRRGAA